VGTVDNQLVRQLGVVGQVVLLLLRVADVTCRAESNSTKSHGFAAVYPKFGNYGTMYFFDKEMCPFRHVSVDARLSVVTDLTYRLHIVVKRTPVLQKVD
jgi:hypothetical protein